MCLYKENVGAAIASVDSILREFCQPSGLGGPLAEIGSRLRAARLALDAGLSEYEEAHTPPEPQVLETQRDLAEWVFERTIQAVEFCDWHDGYGIRAGVNILLYDSEGDCAQTDVNLFANTMYMTPADQLDRFSSRKYVRLSDAWLGKLKEEAKARRKKEEAKARAEFLEKLGELKGD